MLDLTGQRILIVGGTAGLGLASAQEMSAQGAEVVLAGRSEARATEAKAALPDAAILVGDAATPRGAARLVQEATEALGGLDVLLVTAGGDPLPRLIKDTPAEELLSDSTQLLAPAMLTARAAYEVMAAQGGGAILLTASDAGKIATPGEGAIGAAMAGIIMFARALATEGKRDGIRANCLTPSIVRGTPLYDRLMADSFAGKLFARAEAAAALGVAEPRDFAALAAFLASPRAARLTGQAISVNGGISAL